MGNIIKETRMNDRYTHSCECPECGAYIRNCDREIKFHCEKCGTMLHHKGFEEKPKAYELCED